MCGCVCGCGCVWLRLCVAAAVCGCGCACVTPVPWSRCFCSCDQMVNSERLKAHFEDNPRDLQVLRHDAALRPAAVRPSLATVPDYLVPDSLKAAAAAAKDSAGGGAWALDDTMGIEDTGRRRGRKRGRRSHGDPLKTFAVNAAAFGAINAVRSAWAVDVCRVLTLCAAGGRRSVVAEPVRAGPGRR